MTKEKRNTKKRILPKICCVASYKKYKFKRVCEFDYLIYNNKTEKNIFISVNFNEI